MAQVVPLFKLAGLLLKQVSKPLAKQIQHQGMWEVSFSSIIFVWCTAKWMFGSGTPALDTVR